MTEPPVVEVADLAVRFRQRERTIHAVNGVSFRLARGEVLGILGESGSGKSVTLRALMRLLPANCEIDGHVMINGEDVTALPAARLEELRGGTVALIFQEPAIALDPVFTIGEQIAETIVRHEGVGRRQARQRALELLERVQIPSARRRLDSYPHEMSGGMRQRAMIALALSCNPSVLLADEPTTALDVTVQIQILLLLRALQRELGMAVIFVTHDVGAAVEVSDHLAVMYAGRFVETGTVRAVLNKRAHPYTEGLLKANLHGAEPGMRLRTIPGSPPNLASLPRGCSFAARCAYALDLCRTTEPPPVACGDGHLARCLRAEERLKVFLLALILRQANEPWRDGCAQERHVWLRTAPHPSSLPASREKEGPAKREGEGRHAKGNRPGEGEHCRFDRRVGSGCRFSEHPADRCRICR